MGATQSRDQSFDGLHSAGLEEATPRSSESSSSLRTHVLAIRPKAGVSVTAPSKNFDKKFNAKYKKQMHIAHDIAYKFNASSPKNQTLDKRQRVGLKYDQVASLAKLHFYALLEKERGRLSQGLPPDQESLESLDKAQSDWFYAHHLAESWGFSNPDNYPQDPYPILVL